ncbi:MAG: DVUA0089 family protein [Phycisphaerales bacterium]|nr:DVUA0089 family protein [Phycisphaerales bacterium]
MNIKMLSLLAAATALTATTALGAIQGPNHEEDDDAGSNVNNAKKLTGAGALNTITGALTGSNRGEGDFQDVYEVYISNPEIFRLQFAPTDGGFNTMLWLFDQEGRGLLGNDNSFIDGEPTPLSFLGNSSTDGSFQLVNPGRYYIAISGFNSQPVSAQGSIFNLGDDLFGVYGAQGQGANAPQIGWTQDGDIGSYFLHLDGVEFIPLPAPGALALLGLAGLRSRRRRR